MQDRGSALAACSSCGVLSSACAMLRCCHRTYINPKATGKQIVFVSRIMVCVYAVLSGILAIVLMKIGLSLGWVYLFMGVVIGSAVMPIAFSITWKNCSTAGAVGGAISGLVGAIVTWIAVAKASAAGTLRLAQQGATQLLCDCPAAKHPAHRLAGRQRTDLRPCCPAVPVCRLAGRVWRVDDCLAGRRLPHACWQRRRHRLLRPGVHRGVADQAAELRLGADEGDPNDRGGQPRHHGGREWRPGRAGRARLQQGAHRQQMHARMTRHASMQVPCCRARVAPASPLPLPPLWCWCCSVRQCDTQALDRAIKWTWWTGGILTLVLIIAWPLLALPAGVFSKGERRTQRLRRAPATRRIPGCQLCDMTRAPPSAGYFTMWIIIALTWGFAACLVCMLLPWWESRKHVGKILKGIASGQACKGRPTAVDSKDIAAK